MTRRAAMTQEGHPVQTLRGQVTALEAGLAVVLADPEKGAVHRLRTSTRRVEAQLELLAMLRREDAALKGCGKPARRLKDLLGEVRRAAGKVRDLDVQREELAREAADKRTKRKARREAKKLRRYLKERRRKEARKLVETLEGHAKKLARRLEALMEALSPAEGMALTGAHRAELARGWYEAHAARYGEDKAQTSRKKMHGIRKTAKVARYMAEGGAERAAGGSEEEYGELQESGGTWHDMLTLTETARGRLGEASDLTQDFRKREETALEAFRGKIAAGASRRRRR